MYFFNSYVKQYIEEYIALKKNSGYKFEAEEGMFKQIDKALIECNEQGPGISKEFCDKWYERRNVESDRTRYARCILLREFCGYLALMGVDTYCPRLPRPPKSDFIPHIFTQDEIQRIFDASNALTTKYHRSEYVGLCAPALVRFLYATGLRIGEALALSIDDVDFNNLTILVRDSKNGTQRILPIDVSTCKVLSAYAEMRDKSLTGFCEPTTFFCNIHGGPVQSATFMAYFRLFLKRAGIPYYGQFKGPRVHDLRHTFACNVIRKMNAEGLDLYTTIPILSTYLGHKSIYSTNLYVRMTADVFPEIMSKLENEEFNVYPLSNNCYYEEENN